MTLADATTPTTAQPTRLDLDIEIPASDWQPIPASTRDTDPAPPELILIDAVSRLDATTQIAEHYNDAPIPALLTSIAVGAAILDTTTGRARHDYTTVERQLILGRPTAIPRLQLSPDPSGTADHVRYDPVYTTAATPEGFRASRLGTYFFFLTRLALELLARHKSSVVVTHALAVRRDANPRALGILHGPRPQLPPAQQAIAAALRPGDRTPAYALQDAHGTAYEVTMAITGNDGDQRLLRLQSRTGLHDLLHHARWASHTLPALYQAQRRHLVKRSPSARDALIEHLHSALGPIETIKQAVADAQDEHGNLNPWTH